MSAISVILYTTLVYFAFHFLAAFVLYTSTETRCSTFAVEHNIGHRIQRIDGRWICEVYNNNIWRAQ